MKRILVVIVMAIFLGVGGFAISADDKPLPDRNRVMCACGCSNFAVECGCPTAMRNLQDFDKKVKELKGE